ncbi:hypothetical protein ACS5PN_30295 [Roseateles sp. NT4]|uniref:hypothetical protein n=1 Tax=Roseateles sp. NT4 TaxID=3453715 RepID=UPI003EEF4862
MRRIQTVILAGLVAGALDILAAFASYVSQGATVEGILKYIASGLLGASALQGGAAMVALGLFCHFALTTGMATVYLVAAQRLRALIAHPWLWGSVYGVLTWVAMVYVVVPLSGVTGWKLPEGWSIVSGLLSHIFYVGVPIAHITQWGLRGSNSTH